jgi:SPP1 gp7 family putative phage head morphogenesis protein
MANESEFGTRAQAQVHEDISDFAPEKDTLWIAEILTDTVVERLARWNYNFSVKPKLVINYEKEKTGKETAETDKIISDIVPITLEEMYERYKKRKPQDDDIVSFQGKLYVWKDLKAKIEKGEPQAADQPVPPSNFAEFSAGDIDDMDRVVMGDNDIIDGWGDLWGALLEDTIDLKELQKMLEKAGDYKKAIPALDKYKSKKSADLWQKCLTAAALLGESSVQKQIEAANESSEFAELDIDNKFHFGHPDEAIKYFKRKLPIPKAVWNSIDGEMKNYAFYVSQLEDTGLINFIKEKMIEALEKGKTFQMFAKELFEVSGTKQFFGYMKTSFNTNMFNALNYQNGVALLRNVKRFPYWRYSAVMDGKTRESHAAMHGYVARYDDSIWSSWYPPCGFNCRCRITIASQKQFKNIDDDFKKRAKAIHPDEGFETSPVENLKGNVIKLLKKKGAYSLNLNTEIRRAA